MTYAAVALSLLAFVLGLKYSRAVEVARHALRSSQEGLAMLADRTLPDSEKERIARQSALALFAAAGNAAFRLLLALLVPALVLWLAVLSGLVRTNVLFAVLESWPVLIAGVLAFLLALALTR